MVKLFAKRVLIRGARVNFFVVDISEAAFRRGRSLSRRFDPERTNERTRKGRWGQMRPIQTNEKEKFIF